MPLLRCQAPAKTNLTLEVLAKRADGFHEIASLMHTLALADELSFEASDDGVIHLATTPADLCATKDNLVFKAAMALRSKAGRALGATIHLTKKIPHGAGLGGGSSDAATSLLALNELWELGYSVEELSEVAASLGSDIPFFLYAPAAIARGRGEQVERVESLELPKPFGRDLTLVFPALTVSTPMVYQSGAIDLESARVPIDGQPCLPFNRLQDACLKVFPEVGDAMAQAEAILKDAGKTPLHPAFLSGSGSAFIFFWENAGHAAAAATLLNDATPGDWLVFATRLA